MFHVAVCEDDSLQTEIILALLDKYGKERPGIGLKAYSFNSGKAVLKSIQDGQVFHLFLLDILLPGMNGIEIAQKVRIKFADTPLVFLTSTVNYAFDAFRVSAAQYILKPVKKDDLFPVLDGITAALKQEKEPFFLLTIQKNTIKIPFRSIVCVELAGRVLRFYLADGTVLLSNTIRKPFAEMIAPLLADRRFLHKHKSYALNMEYVREIGNTTIRLKGGIEVPIPRYNFARAKSTYFAWLKEQE